MNARENSAASELTEDLCDSPVEKSELNLSRQAAIIESSDDAIISKDLKGNITSWNHGAGKIFGYTAEEMVGRSFLRLIPEEREEEVKVILNKIWRGERVGHFETICRTQDGRLIHVSITASPILNAVGKVIGVSKIARNITELKHREHEIERLKRLYAALSHVNQAIVRAPTQEALFERICRVLVEHGEFQMAWIGLEEGETSRLQPTAVWGDAHDYVPGIEIYTDERREGNGPAGRAFRDGRALICNDMLNDPTLLPWLPRIKKSGFRASAFFPIRRKGKVCGVLSVYAKELFYFHKKESQLLEEAVGDISFALDNMELRKVHEQAEKSVRDERDFSQAVLDSLPGMLYLYDESGKFLRWNQNFETVSGYSAAEIETMHPLDFFDGGDKDLLAGRVQEVFTKGEASMEAGFVSKDGRVTPYYFTGVQVELNGKLCLVGVGIDMTERKCSEAALLESELRFRTTLDNILEGCQLLGFNWHYLYLNDAAANHNRRPNCELLGRTMQEAWPGIEQTRIFTLIERGLNDRVSAEEEVEFIFADGTRGWFDMGVHPVNEGVLLLSVEKTERKEAELALQMLNLTLERKVVQRTEELAAALVRAEAADQIKSAFLATMSHELRTPLNSIIGFTGIILQGLTGPLNAEQAKQLGMVRGSARHLLELINDVLDLSKIEAGQLEVRRETFDLTESIQRVATLVKPMADKKRLSLEMVLEPEICELVSDRRRVEQILINLLNNAIKFTEVGNVTLTLERLVDFQMTPYAKPCLAVRLSIADTGIGIKSEDLNTLFQPFRQVDTGLSRQHEGTGLGLAICRRLATLLEGRILASSELGVGSVFTLILPFKNVS